MASRPFVKVGDRVKYMRHGSQSRYRMDTWPVGVWLGDREVDGTVTQYHPEMPAVRVGGTRVEGLDAWALVRWDNGACSAIDRAGKGERWAKRK